MGHMEKEESEEGVLEEEESEEEESEEEEELETTTSTWKSYRLCMEGWPWMAMIFFTIYTYSL